MTKLNRYICRCNSAVLLRVCPACLCSSPRVRSSCCLWACMRLPGSCLFTERLRRQPLLAGPSLFIGCAIYRLRYTRTASPTGLAVLRMGDGVISARFERGCSLRCPSRLTMLTNLARRRIPPFVQTGAARSLDLWRKRIRFQVDQFKSSQSHPVRAAIRRAVFKMGSTHAKDCVGLSHSLQLSR